MLKPDFHNERYAQRVHRPAEPAGWRLLARSGEAALLADELGAVHAANPAAHRVLGHTTGRLIGGNWLNLLHPDDARSVAAHLEAGTGRDLGLCFMLDVSDRNCHAAAFQATLLRHHHLLAALTGTTVTEADGKPLCAVLLAEKVASALQRAAHEAPVRIANSPCEKFVLTRP